jgi:hypothetical protein
MIGPQKPRSSLARITPSGPTSSEELAQMRRRAWHHQGVVMLRPEDVLDAWARQAIINEAIRLYGKRATND